ncbi:MAG: hypothetical protein J5496_08065 [Lachnospiraceae bacterium]|nr:hypothetical protein [Lachnospiraceae bacterium]
MKLWDLVSGAPAVAMLGMCKNAGKTTAFNSLIREQAARGSGTLGMTSIGRDGEGRDLVTGTDKPPIWLYEGMLAATAEQLLPLCDVSREILASTGLYTSLGEVILFRAKSDGFVQLAGPAIVEQLTMLRKQFQAFGADCVLIDGALSRRSPLAGVTDGVCVLSTGASLDRDVDKVVAETAFVAELLGLKEKTLPAAGETASENGPAGEEKSGAVGPGALPGSKVVLFREDGSRESAERLSDIKYGTGEETILVRGALTEAQAAALVKDGRKKARLTLAVRDGSCLMMRRETYARLRGQGLSFAVRKGSRLAAVTVNPFSAGGWSFDADEFLAKMQAAVNVPVLNVKTQK